MPRTSPDSIELPHAAVLGTVGMLAKVVPPSKVDKVLTDNGRHSQRKR